MPLVITAILGVFLASVGIGGIAGLIALISPDLGSSFASFFGEELKVEPTARATRGLTWIDQFAAPAIADVDGDGEPDLLAPFQTREGSNTQTWVGAFRGRDFTELWRIGPLVGTPTRQVGVVVAGDRLVLQEPFGVVSIVELATGRRVGQHQLPENPPYARLCLMDPEGTEVQVDGQMIVDAAKGTARVNRVPAWHRRADHCVFQRLPGTSTESGDRYAWQLGLPVAGRSSKPKPTFPGVSVTRAFVDGPHGVAVVKAMRGPPVPMLIGFSSKTLEERWRIPLDSLRPETADQAMDLIDLGLGTVVFTYRPSSAARPVLLALDAETGDKRWEAELPGHGLKATFGGGRVWIRVYPGPGRGSVEVFDLLDGSLRTFGGVH